MASMMGTKYDDARDAGLDALRKLFDDAGNEKHSVAHQLSSALAAQAVSEALASLSNPSRSPSGPPAAK